MQRHINMHLLRLHNNNFNKKNPKYLFDTILSPFWGVRSGADGHISELWPCEGLWDSFVIQSLTKTTPKK